MVILIQLFVVSSEYNRWFTQWEVNGPLICCVNILFHIYNKPVSVIAVRAYFFPVRCCGMNTVHWTLTIQGHRLLGPCFNEVAGCQGDLQRIVNKDKNSAEVQPYHFLRVSKLSV